MNVSNHSVNLGYSYSVMTDKDLPVILFIKLISLLLVLILYMVPYDFIYH